MAASEGKPGAMVEVGSGNEAADTRTRLLDAAAEVYQKSGWEGTSLRGVAERAGVTTGAVYAHFEGKSDLLLAVCERAGAESVLDVRGQVASVTSLRKKLELLHDWYAHRLVAGRITGRLVHDLWRDAFEHPKMRKRLVALYDQIRGSVAENMQAELGPLLAFVPAAPNALGILLTAVFDGLLIQQLIDGNSKSVDALFEVLYMLETLLPPAFRNRGQ